MLVSGSAVSPAAIARHAAPAPGGGGLGPELAVNGTFDDVAGWVGPSWTLGSGVMTAATTGVPRGCSNPNTPLAEIGATYRVSFEVVSYTTGGVSVRYGNGVGTIRGAVGVYVEDIVAQAGTGAILFASPNTNLAVDNLSIRKVL